MVRLKIYKIEVLLLVIVILDLPESIHPSALLLEVSSCFSRVIVATTKYPCSTRSLSSC